MKISELSTVIISFSGIIVFLVFLFIAIAIEKEETTGFEVPVLCFVCFLIVYIGFSRPDKTPDLTLTPISIHCPEVEVCHSTILINDKDTITIQLPSNNIKLNKTTKVNFSK